jgi:hypothetical protein
LFDSRKGLEPIIFDFFDPNTLLAVVYRIKQIRFDLDRKFMGSVINLAGILYFSLQYFIILFIIIYDSNKCIYFITLFFWLLRMLIIT